MIIRREISGFIKNNKGKIQNLLRKLIMVAIIIFIATIMIFSGEKINNNTQQEENKGE